MADKTKRYEVARGFAAVVGGRKRYFARDDESQRLLSELPPPKIRELLDKGCIREAPEDAPAPKKPAD